MHARQIAIVEAQFSSARMQLAKTGALLHPVAPVQPPTLNNLRAAILRWFHDQEISRSRTGLPDDPTEFELALENLVLDESQLSGEEGWQAAERALPKILKEYGYSQPQGDMRRIAVTLVQRAMVEGVRRNLDVARTSVERSHDVAFSEISVAAAPPPMPQAASLTFGALVTGYLTASERASMAPKTRLKYNGFARVLKDILGADTPVNLITRSDCRRAEAILRLLPPNAFQRWPAMPAPQLATLAKRDGIAPMHPNSVSNHLDFLSSVFSFGEREQLLPANPAKGLTRLTISGALTRTSGRGQRSFTSDELCSIFLQPLYTGCENDRIGYATRGPNRPRRGRFWVPLISLFAGLRLNEACQLGVSDLTEVDGIPLLLIRAEAEGSRLKTEASQRRVPVHAELIRMGLLQHLTQMRRNGEARLFPDLQVSGMGNYSDSFSKWFGRFLTKAGITARGAVFHSFRHVLHERLQEAGAPKEIRDAICGWAATGQGAGYGPGFSARLLAEHLNRVEYSGLDLTHLYPPGVPPDNMS